MATLHVIVTDGNIQQTCEMKAHLRRLYWLLFRILQNCAACHKVITSSTSFVYNFTKLFYFKSEMKRSLSESGTYVQVIKTISSGSGSNKKNRPFCTPFPPFSSPSTLPACIRSRLALAQAFANEPRFVTVQQSSLYRWRRQGGTRRIRTRRRSFAAFFSWKVIQ